MLSEGRVGPISATDGSINPVRLTKTGEIAFSQAHGAYQEAVLRGGVWCLSSAAAGITVAAAHVIGAAAGSPLVGMFNPINSGVNLVMLRANSSWNSGTTGAGGLVWGCIAANAGVTATGANGAINMLTLASGGSLAKTFTNSALTGAGASVLLRFLGGPTVGALAANANQTVNEVTDGDIICPPGGVIGLFAATAGTSPIVGCSVTWEEVKI
jgi:hypothetical protein